MQKTRQCRVNRQQKDKQTIRDWVFSTFLPDLITDKDRVWVTGIT